MGFLLAGVVIGFLAGAWAYRLALRARSAQVREIVYQPPLNTTDRILTPLPPRLVTEGVREDTSLYPDIVENIDTEIAVFDARGRYRYVNDKAVSNPEMRAWLIGKTNVEYSEKWNKPREFAIRRDALIRQAMEERRTTEWAEEMVTDAGETLHMIRKAAPILAADGSVRGAIGFGHDVTARTRAEAALRLAEEGYRSFIDHTPLGVFRTNKDRKPVFVNAALAGMLGYDSAADLLSANHSRDVYGEPGERDRMVASYQEDGKPGFQLTWRKKDGSRIIIRMNLVTIYDEQGNADHWEGFVEDVTPLVEAERALRDSEERLQQSQKLEAIGRLAGGIAHDFNNLLAVIRGHNEFRASGGGSPADALEHSVEIGMAVDRAEHLTRQLLAFGRKQMLQPELMNLNSAVGDDMSMLGPLIAAHVSLETSLQPDIWTVRADPGQVSQVIVNLVLNATVAMPDGGTLTIETRNVVLSDSEVRAHGLTQTEFVRTAVRDCGTGMDAATIARVFEPFFTTKEMGRGTGLGLSTVYGIIQQSGGFISVDSKLGEGSSFDFFLPRANAEPVASGVPESAPARSDTGGKTILLAEDEDGLRKLAVKMLAMQGYTILQARNGRHALEVAAEFEGRIDLLITDVMMPEMGGPELARTIAESRKGIPTLFISGYAQGTLEVSGLGTNQCFLQKPFTSAGLATAAREALATATA